MIVMCRNRLLKHRTGKRLLRHPRMSLVGANRKRLHLESCFSVFPLFPLDSGVSVIISSRCKRLQKLPRLICPLYRSWDNGRPSRVA